MERDQFKQFYSQNFRRIYGYAFALTASHESAEDITQEAFLRFLMNGVGHARIEKPEAWLTRVTHNLCIQTLRKRSPRIVPGDWKTMDHPERLLSTNEMQRQILAALAELSETQRECLTLREYGDLSYREIAGHIGISIDQVKVQIFRARQNLKKRLGEMT